MTQSCQCQFEAKEKELLEELSQVIEDYKNKEGALIPVLQIAQSLFGYLPEEAMKLVSAGLDIPYSQVAGVVSFYSLFSTVPQGKYVIRVCLGTACYVRGGKEVMASIEKELGIGVGETTADRLFSLEVGRCFGACGLAPVIMINDETFQRVKPNKVSQIIAEYRAMDKMGAEAGEES